MRKASTARACSSPCWPAPLTITSPSAELEAAREWAVDLTLQFVGATKPRLATIAFD